MNKALLKKLGFQDKEIEVYVALLKKGRATPAELAKTTKINRATVYTIAKKLEGKGVVSEDLASSSLHLIAHSPDHLGKSLDNDRKALKEKEKLMQQAIAELSHVARATAYPVPKIRFVEEERVEAFLYEQCSHWDKSSEKHGSTWWGFQDHTFVEHYQDWIDWFWARATKDATVKLLTNESNIEERIKGRYKNRQIRFWEQSAAFTATTWVIGDYLVMISTKNEPHYLVEIHDATMAHNMRELFKSIWSNN